MDQDDDAEQGTPESNESAITVIADLVQTAATGIPAPVQKTLFKAFHRLCMAGVDVGVAKLEGWAAESRAASKSRIKVLNVTGGQIAKRLQVGQEYVDAALENASAQIVKKRINVDAVVVNAVKEIQQTPSEALGDISGRDQKEISDDWLNAFEQEASNMSSVEMQHLFGKILAGEIRRPSSFSIRTVKLMAQLDNRPAQLFRQLCSRVCALRQGSRIFDARVINVKGPAGSNGLSDYGLSFDNLNILFEYGLIISDYNSYMTYDGAIAQGHNVSMSFQYAGRQQALAPKSPMNKDQIVGYKVNGVALTRAGLELLDIVEIEEDLKYTEALTNFFDRQGFKVVDVGAPAEGKAS